MVKFNKGIHKVANNLMKVDVFAEPAAAFKVNKSDTYPSPFGTVMSLFIFLILTTYTINKFAIMSDEAVVNYKVVSEPVDFNDDTTISHEESNFQVLYFLTNKTTGDVIQIEEAEKYLAIKASLVHHDSSTITPLLLRMCSSNRIFGDFYEPKENITWNHERIT